MKTIARFCTLAALGSALTASAFGGTVNMKFLNAGNSDNGVGTYPYNFTVNGQSMSLLCDSFNNHVVTSETWQANEHSLFSGPYQFTNGVDAYKEAAYIFLEILAGTVNSNDANFAIWDIFDHADVDHNSGFNVDAQSILANAMTNAPSKADSFYTNIVLYTPVDGTQTPPNEGTPQEFFGYTSQPQVPEPASLALMGTGIIGIAFAGRKLWA